MFHSDTEQCIKEQIMKNFSEESHHLHIVITTIAFGMGVDVLNFHTVIHFGASTDRDIIFKEFVGQAEMIKMLSLFFLPRKGGKQHIDDEMMLHSCF